MFEIHEDDLSGEQTRALLALHLAGMHANSPPGSVFALDLSGLQAPEITVWSVWDGNALLGIGALKVLDGTTGEIKSMRTHPAHAVLSSPHSRPSKRRAVRTSGRRAVG